MPELTVSVGNCDPPVDSSTGHLVARRKPRPRPRLSLVSPNTLNMLPPYENVSSSGWLRDVGGEIETKDFRHERIIRMDNPDKEDSSKRDIVVAVAAMAASSFQPKVTSSAPGTRHRATLATSNANLPTHSHIPLARNLTKHGAGVTRIAKTAMAIVATDREDAGSPKAQLHVHLKPHHNSPHLVRRQAEVAAADDLCRRQNGHSKPTKVAPVMARSSESERKVSKLPSSVSHFESERNTNNTASNVMSNRTSKVASKMASFESESEIKSSEFASRTTKMSSKMASLSSSSSSSSLETKKRTVSVASETSSSFVHVQLTSEICTKKVSASTSHLFKRFAATSTRLRHQANNFMPHAKTVADDDDQQMTTRSMETLPLASTNFDIIVAANQNSRRKSEYRKSVSIPPHLVAHLTNKFNALSEVHNCQSSMAATTLTTTTTTTTTQTQPAIGNVNSDVGAARRPTVSTSPGATLKDGSCAATLVSKETKADVTQLCRPSSSSPSSIAPVSTLTTATTCTAHTIPMIQQQRHQQQQTTLRPGSPLNVSVGLKLNSCSMTHLHHHHHRHRHQQQEEEDDNRHLQPATRTVDFSRGQDLSRHQRDRSNNSLPKSSSSSSSIDKDDGDRDEDGDSSSRLTSVKEAIRNYEVAFLKSSTSSPELLQRSRLSIIARCDLGSVAPGGGAVGGIVGRQSVSQRSQTLPCTGSTSSYDAGAALSLIDPAKSGGSVATLPNIPYRSGPNVSSLLPRAVGRIRECPLTRGAALSRPNNSCPMADERTTKISTDQPTRRSTSTSSSRFNGDIQLNGSSLHSKCPTKSEEPCSQSEVFRAKPVSVVAVDPKPRSPSKSASVFIDQYRRSLRPSVDEDRNSFSFDCGATEMGSMDLLAEIESHPSLRGEASSAVAAAAKKKASSMSSTSSSSSSSVAPNLSFLWKDSTQTFVQSKVAPSSYGGSTSSMDSVPASRPSAMSHDRDADEPLYEELFNFAGRPRRNYARPPMELPKSCDDVPLIEDFSTSSDDSSVSGGEGMITYYLESQELARAVDEVDEAVDNKVKEKGDGNESWTDYSDSDDDHSKTSNSSKTKMRSNAGKRRRNGRNLMRRSWSQSLRDLANVHRNEGMSQQECLNDIATPAGWEEALSSDGSAENSDAKRSSTNGNVKISDAATPDTEFEDDKSPSASIVTQETYEIRAETTKSNGSKERKAKKVKRNWTWSRAEFKLDISSKFEKIRLTSKKSHRSMSEDASSNGGAVVSSLLSPTKKSKQWNFKTKLAQMKSHGTVTASPDVKGERSPNSCAQFYVPTYNEDGTLATSPCSEESIKSETESRPISAEVLPSGQHIFSSREGSSRRLRRVSSGASGMIARPKTAPPAPPMAAMKSISSSPNQTILDNVAAFDFGYASQTGSSGSLDHEPVSRVSSNGKDTDSLRFDVTVPKTTLTLRHRSSVTSETSSEAFVESVNKNLVNETAVLRDSTEVLEPALSDRESRISQLELPALFPSPDVSRLSCKLSPFNDEPLYQFYNAAARLRAAHENQVSDDDDGRDLESPSPYYESIYQMKHGLDLSGEVHTNEPSEEERVEDDEGDESSTCKKTTAMELVRTTAGGVRTLWCEVPEVRLSGVLDALSMQKRRLQEAMFEVITSEASYFKSLNVLVDCFLHCPLLSDDYSMNCVLSRREAHVLFSDVIPVRATSERLLADLEVRWQESIVISDICDIILEHATKHFEVYVKYCSNQLYQDRCLKKLKESNPAFVEVVRKIETSPACQQLSMHSFLMLPMQRITRFPLLVDAIFQRLEFGTQQYDTCKQALATLNKIVHECNEGAHRMERMEEMLNISRQLDFRDCRCLPLISASRWLVKKGDLTRLVFGDSSSKLSFGRRCAKQSVYLFLFTDLLIVTKKKSDDCYNVIDYCPRNLVQATEIESQEQLPGRTNEVCRNIFQLSMLQNHDNKTVEMFFSCHKESDLTRWVEAVTPRKSENPDERIYEEWDCPQVQVIHSYVAQQPDELHLEESDVVNVFRKMADGWFQGERIRDGVQGWFPSNYTVEIVSSHIRARNLRQRYRLLALSHSYVENQRKKELSKTK